MKFIIGGKNKLSGEVSLLGAKNAASKAMVASLLTNEPCELFNFPKIGDIEITAELCREIGSKIAFSPDSLKIETPEIKNFRVSSLSRKNRIPILALGPLLSRSGVAEVPILGGDKIGPRPVNLHLESLKMMGAEIEVLENCYRASAKTGLKGARIVLDFPSVGATENIILAAVLASGRTVIENAAIEPEVIDLIKMLQKMGAIIELGANRKIFIDGVSCLHGASHFLLPDRNEAVSFACLAVATDGNVFVRGALQDHLLTFLNAIRKVGGEYEIKNNEGISFFRKNGKLEGLEIETDTHPGFMTDWQQPFVVLLTQAKGVSIVHETIYEDRFLYTRDLNLMGADIKVFTRCLGELPCRFKGKNFSHSAVISGPSALKGIYLKVQDLRAGMAHVIAALVAEGTSEIDGIEEIDRGYYKIDERLQALGADIKRVD
ncbi:MAG: UDP-N-acetylglucosamine 1-carboxyvinyltransferase [Candidatus Paceibacterota bacterium]